MQTAIKIIAFVLVVLIISNSCTKLKEYSNKGKSFITGAIIEIEDILPSKTKEYREIENKIKTLKIGMTREEVQKIVGKAEKISQYEYKGIKYEDWYFKTPVLASTQTSCSFNPYTGKVIEVIYGENYHLKDK
jgi:hypothetical protein